MPDLFGPLPPSITRDSTDPLGDAMASFLYSRKRETAGLDFKLTLNTRKGGDFAKVVKDCFAFANSGGGYLILGFRQLPSGRYEPTGLPADFHIDQAELQEKFNAYSPEPLTVGYREDERVVDGERRKFAIVYFPPAAHLLNPSKDAIYQDGKGQDRVGAKNGLVYVRRGTQSIVATPSEEERARVLLTDANYRTSLISGRPDHVEEVLFSDVFSIRELPSLIYHGKLRTAPPTDWSPDLSAYVWRGKDFYSFDDPRGSVIAEGLLSGTVTSLDRAVFGSEPEGARLSIELLKWELVGHASALGLCFDQRRGRLFYPLGEGRENREVHWKGLSRPARRKVASRRYSPSLHGQVCFHLAVSPSFLRIGRELYLKLQPGFLFTADGSSPIHGRAQGIALTSIENSVSNFNLAYLRGVLFWAGQLAGGSDTIVIRDDFGVSGDPIQTTVSIGLQSDVVGLQRITSDEALPPGTELEG